MRSYAKVVKVYWFDIYVVAKKGIFVNSSQIIEEVIKHLATYPSKY